MPQALLWIRPYRFRSNTRTDPPKPKKRSRRRSSGTLQGPRDCGYKKIRVLVEAHAQMHRNSLWPSITIPLLSNAPPTLHRTRNIIFRIFDAAVVRTPSVRITSLMEHGTPRSKLFSASPSRSFHPPAWLARAQHLPSLL